MTDKIRKELIANALRSWIDLNKHINKMTEAEVESALSNERANGRRVTFVRRLHQRLTKLRTTRERASLCHGRDI